MDKVLEKLLKVEHGFKPFKEEAEIFLKSHTVGEAKTIGFKFLKSDSYQIRSLATFIFGFIAVKDKSILSILKEQACIDKSWQVQEIIAKAFDQFCKDNGYEKSLPQIKEWLGCEHPNVCRAVTEGLRIWTGRSYFNENPQEAIKLLGNHKASESEYLRKSVGNALRDIAKKHSKLVESEISQWDLSDNNSAFTYRYVTKKNS